MTRFAAIAAFAALLTTAGAATAAGREPVRRDVEGYAQAVCLTRQHSAEVRAQGEGWASIIVGRGRGDIEDWAPLQKAVTSEMARRPMYLLHGDGPVAASSSPAPVAYCAELLDTPAVRAAVERTIRKMAPAYRRR